MNKLPQARRAQITGLLCESNSLRATSRLADVSINTVLARGRPVPSLSAAAPTRRKS